MIKGKRMRLFGNIVILYLLGTGAFAIDSNVDLFWKNWEKSDYQRAKNVGETVSLERPEYLIPLYYIDQIDTEKGYQEVIQQLLDLQKNAFANIDRLLEDCKNSIGSDTYLYYFVKAVIQNLKKATWEDTIDKSLKIKQSADALLYRFINSREHSIEDLRQAEKILPWNPSLLFINLRANLIMAKDISNSFDDCNYLLISNKLPLTVNDYRYLGQVFIGIKSLNIIGPAGPNGEPFYGELFHVTNWTLIDQMAPLHKLFFACTIGYDGFQNSSDAERILRDVPEELLEQYRDEVYILRIFENFNSYNYDKVLSIANEVVSNKGLSSRMIYNEYYNMAYKLEMNGMKYKIKLLIMAAPLLYQKAFENIPSWAGFSRNYIAYEWARSLYYNERYREAADLLEKNVDLSSFSFGTVILSWSYYRLNDKVKGKIYEDLFNKYFPDQKKIRDQFYSELSNINAK